MDWTTRAPIKPGLYLVAHKNLPRPELYDFDGHTLWQNKKGEYLPTFLAKWRKTGAVVRFCGPIAPPVDE